MEVFILNDDLVGLKNYIKNKSNNDEDLKLIYLKKCRQILNEKKINIYLNRKNIYHSDEEIPIYTFNDAIKINDVEFLLDFFKNTLFLETIEIFSVASIECFKILVDNFKNIELGYFFSLKYVDTIEKLELIFQNKDLLDKLNQDEEYQSYSKHMLDLALRYKNQKIIIFLGGKI